MNYANKKAVIFDLDGTLADTVGAIAEAVNLSLAQFGFPAKTTDEVRRAVGNGPRMLIRRVLPERYFSDDAVIDQVLKVYDRMYGETYMHTESTYDGIQETLHTLYERNFKLAVLSNKQDLYVKKLAEKYFPNGEILIARGQRENVPLKPDPTALKIVMEDMKVAPAECVFVGDSGVDVQTAANAGVDLIAVAWGFAGRQALIECGATVIADRPQEILTLIHQ